MSHGQAADVPLVSIVTVVFNGEATLERTIQSVLAQTHPRIEYIIVDGGSTDGTLGIIKRHEHELARWTTGPDQGIYDAMNKGIALCTGDWVGLINADDWYAPDAVERVMKEVADRGGVNIAHGDIWIHYPNGTQKIKRAGTSGFLLRHWEMVLNHPSFFVRRALYRDHPFNAGLRVSGDHHWTLRAWLEDRRQFQHIGGPPLAHFTAGGASMMTSLRKSLREHRLICDSLGLGVYDRVMGAVVRIALHLPRAFKLWINQYWPPLRRSGSEA